MPKTPITFPADLYAALQNEAKRRNTTIAALVREYVAEALAKQGIKVTQHVQWGGKRVKSKEEDED
jgi:hypothetical protein